MPPTRLPAQCVYTRSFSTMLGIAGGAGGEGGQPPGQGRGEGRARLRVVAVMDESHQNGCAMCQYNTALHSRQFFCFPVLHRCHQMICTGIHKREQHIFGHCSVGLIVCLISSESSPTEKNAAASVRSHQCRLVTKCDKRGASPTVLGCLDAQINWFLAVAVAVRTGNSAPWGTPPPSPFSWPHRVQDSAGRFSA